MNETQLPIDTGDALACKALIEALPLTNVAESRQTLVLLLTGLSHRSPPAPAYLEVLETLRAPLSFIQDALAQRYAAKPIPLSPTEAEAFHQVIALWQSMARAYARVAQLGAHDAPVQERLALICQRCVYYAGQVILECFRARREPGRGAWVDLHGYFATAEEWGIDRSSVTDPLNVARRSQSAAETYATVLLVDLARPYSRTAQEFVWICRWARDMSIATTIRPLSGAPPARAFGVDLMRDVGTRPLDQLKAAESVRHFDTQPLVATLQRLMVQLKEGALPTALGLGEDCPASRASALLLLLYKNWCLNAAARRFPRRGAQGEALACFGFEAMHYYISGDEFHQPEHVRIYSRGEMERIWTFRDQLDPTQLHVRTSQVRLDFPRESWQVVNQSVSGFRLLRSAAGQRIENGQLFCLQPPDGEHPLLAQVSWSQMQGNDLLIGVQVLSGIPQGVAVRPTGFQVSSSERYLRAFLLPAVAATGEATTLVTPRGWFQPQRLIEAYTDRPLHLRLDALIDQGPDFERMTFTRI